MRSILGPLWVSGHGPILGEPGRVEEAGPDEDEHGPGPPPRRVIPRERGKSSIDEHFTEIVWVPGHGEKTVGDEPLPGAEDEILLDIRGVVEPDAEDVDRQDDCQLTRIRLITLAGREQDYAAPEPDTHPHELKDGGAERAGRLPAPVPVQPLLQQPGQSINSMTGSVDTGNICPCTRHIHAEKAEWET